MTTGVTFVLCVMCVIFPVEPALSTCDHIGRNLDTNNLFKIQKRIIRIMTNSSNRDSCRELFKSLSVLPLQSQYILSISVFVVGNKNLFTFNSEVYNINTVH
jgi:hypothetical protein